MEDGQTVQPENPVVIVEEKEAKTKAAAWIERHIPFNRMIWVFFVMNMLNYTERVVVSGSSMKMLEFIRKSVSSHENTYLGALTSIFIGGVDLLAAGCPVQRTRPKLLGAAVCSSRERSGRGCFPDRGSRVRE